jgi:hypothetical protein
MAKPKKMLKDKEKKGKKENKRKLKMHILTKLNNSNGVLLINTSIKS